MPTHQFLCGSDPLQKFSQRLRDYAKDKTIDRFNAERTDGFVIYGNKYIRNGKRFFIYDSSRSLFRKYNRNRILDLFDALHNDPETRDMAYPRVFISDDDCDYYHPGKLQEMVNSPDSIYRSTTKSLFPHVHLQLQNGLLNQKAALHEFGHYRDITLRGQCSWAYDVSDEQTANDRLYHEDEAADHAFRINWFFRPAYRLPDASLTEERADVLQAYSCHYPENSYIERIIKTPDKIGGRRRYMSLREPGGSTSWLKRLVRRLTLIRLLMTKLTAMRQCNKGR